MTLELPNGIYKFPDREYFDIQLPSSSTTKRLMSGTNAHLRHEMDNKASTDSDALTVGSYVHSLLFDADSIASNYIRMPKVDRRTKEGKEQWESFSKKAEITKARVITPDQIEEAESLVNAVLGNHDAGNLIDQCSNMEFTVIGDIAGRKAKAKIDAMIEVDPSLRQAIVIDVKTAQSASPREFARSAAVFGYPHQAAFYRRILASVGVQMVDFVFVVVEKTKPNLVACYRLEDMDIEIADRRIDGLVDRWWKVHHGDRTGYQCGIKTLAMPEWWKIGEPNEQ